MVVYDTYLILNLATSVVRIGRTVRTGFFFYENTVMGIELMEQARKFEGRVSPSSERSVRISTDIPLCEEDLHDGHPEETNAPCVTGKIPLNQSKAYRKQYGLDPVFLIDVNTLGPRDDFDLESTHLIPDITRKYVEGNQLGA